MLKNIFKYGLATIDFKNRAFLKSQIAKYQESDIFKDNDIFVRRYRELCVILSLAKDEQEAAEQVLDEDNQSKFEDALMYAKMDKINRFITKEMKCGELFTPNLNKFPDSYSYKLVYKPYYMVLSTSFIIYNTLFWSGVGFAIWKIVNYFLF